MLCFPCYISFSNYKNRFTCFYINVAQAKCPTSDTSPCKNRGKIVGANCVRPRAVKDRPYKCKSQAQKDMRMWWNW